MAAMVAATGMKRCQEIPIQKAIALRARVGTEEMHSMAHPVVRVESTAPTAKTVLPGLTVVSLAMAAAARESGLLEPKKRLSSRPSTNKPCYRYIARVKGFLGSEPSRPTRSEAY
jgi:hypothetical protein